jgi:N6-L-threonylcarbamoyladenine synthase
MNILAIETSCDETGVAIVKGQKTRESEFSFTVQGAALLSQAALHAQYGGVYPNLAKREHEKNLPIILEQALRQAESKLGREKIDAIAVTNGPGLEPALWTGIEFAKRLAQEKKLPLLPTNHMEGHLLSSLVSFDGPCGTLKNTSLPVLALLISGGHTEFVLMESWLEYEIVGETLDDAVGECFDKVARMLGLPYPGGPEISKLATTARQRNLHSEIKLPRPMLQTKDCDVSFSGLKTAALYALRDVGGIQNLSSDDIAAFAREFEDAIVDVLVAKTRRALSETSAMTFVIGGGVAANGHIRESLRRLVTEEFSEVDFRLPEISITGDNAIMIAIAALVRSLDGVQIVPDPTTIRAHGRLSISAEK